MNEYTYSRDNSVKIDFDPSAKKSTLIGNNLRGNELPFRKIRIGILCESSATIHMKYRLLFSEKLQFRMWSATCTNLQNGLTISA